MRNPYAKKPPMRADGTVDLDVATCPSSTVLNNPPPRNEEIQCGVTLSE